MPLPGHYASVIKLDERTGIALSTDGVGTKLLVAEELGRFDTVGIDCVAMNVNDVICVGAEPLAMLDYIAIDRADPAVCEEIGVGLARGAELAGIEIPGGELAQLGEMVRGVDVSGACFGTVALDAIVDGSAVQPGDVVIGLPSSGLHSNGYTLARSALAGIPLGEDPEGGSAGRSATCCSSRPRSTSSRCSSCCAPRSRCAASPTSPPAALGNLLRLAAEVGYEIDDAAAGAADLRADPGARRRLRRGDARGLQHGLRLLLRRRRRATRQRGARSRSRPHYPGAKRIGRAADAGAVATIRDVALRWTPAPAAR